MLEGIKVHGPSRPPHVDRRAWRAAVAGERRALASGRWGAWERTPLPAGVPGHGWTRQIRWAAKNAAYCVLVRPLEGGMHHLAIRTVSSREPPWRDLQRIKSELMGAEAVAVQVCPADADIIDAADMYHLWVYPAGHQLGFGLHLD